MGQTMEGEETGVVSDTSTLPPLPPSLSSCLRTPLSPFPYSPQVTSAAGSSKPCKGEPPTEMGRAKAQDWVEWGGRAWQPLGLPGSSGVEWGGTWTALGTGPGTHELRSLCGCFLNDRF